MLLLMGIPKSQGSIDQSLLQMAIWGNKLTSAGQLHVPVSNTLLDKLLPQLG